MNRLELADVVNSQLVRRTILANAAFVTGGVVVATGLALVVFKPTNANKERGPRR